VGDVRSFHASPYSIFRDNELLGLAGLDAAIAWVNKGSDLKVTLLSSSMVYESACTWPSTEGSELSIAPPKTSYGLQKLAFESAAKAAAKQYGLRYTILRLFNVVGVPQSLMAVARREKSNANLPGLSHVLPDLVRKSMQTAESLEVLGKGSQVRHFTHGSDIAEALSLSLISDAAINEDFNVAHHTGVAVEGLVKKIWAVIHGPGVKPDVVPSEAIPNDVNWSEPDVSKAQRLLGFSASIGIDETIREVVEFVRISESDL